jgi:hypothetical protein
MNRSHIKALRPEIPSAETTHSKEIETFQNAVLRPILKFQNAWIMTFILANQQFNQLREKQQTNEQLQVFILDYIGKQNALKNQLIGSVIGLLTEEELVFYFTNQSDLNKRIYQMICQRIYDNITLQ